MDKQNFVADLHTHSCVSDGTDTPAELVKKAKAQGIAVLALTDHDTTFGWDEAIVVAKKVKLNLIPGIEVTCKHAGKTMHLLAYLPDPDNNELVKTFATQREFRETRAKRIVQRLAKDYDISWEDLITEFPNKSMTIGRPHIADTLVKLGHFKDRTEVFDTILQHNSPYVIHQKKISAAEALKMVHSAGGVTVVAHPMGSNRNAYTIADIKELVYLGLKGVEVYHREHSKAHQEELKKFAKKHDLIVTGSSDYHGTGKPNKLAENTTTLKAVKKIIELASGTPPILFSNF
ncbi:MAG: PHP domain-containing protein [Micrococcaceae bacterium]